jgi:hypothetical protein
MQTTAGIRRKKGGGGDRNLDQLMLFTFKSEFVNISVATNYISSRNTFV